MARLYRVPPIVKYDDWLCQGIQKKFNRRGSLLQQNTKRKLIDNEAYLKKACLYIHLNPVSHGFVTRPGQWRYSSYKEYLSGKARWIDNTEIIDSFGERNSFIALHRQYLENIYHRTNSS